MVSCRFYTIVGATTYIGNVSSAIRRCVPHVADESVACRWTQRSLTECLRTPNVAAVISPLITLVAVDAYRAIRRGSFEEALFRTRFIRRQVVGIVRPSRPIRSGRRKRQQRISRVGRQTVGKRVPHVRRRRQ